MPKKTQPGRKKREPLAPLKGPDRERMSRLFEEITGRVQEMSAIVNRLHGTPVQWSSFRILSSGGAGAGAGAGGAPEEPGVITVVCNEHPGECSVTRSRDVRSVPRASLRLPLIRLLA